MEIHHLVHNEFGSSNYSRVQGIGSSFQHVASTEETSYFPLSFNKHESSKMSFDQVSEYTNVAKKTNNEFYQTFILEDNNKISSINCLENEETSNSISSLPKFQNSFELPLLPTISTLNSPSLASDLLLVNSDLWSQFYHVNNEMIITKAGRCIFPLLKFQPVNLDPTVNYSFVIDFVQVSKDRYRFKKGCWISIGLDRRKFLPNNSNSRDSKFGTVRGNPFTHPDSPQTGAYWMNFGVSFPKIKLTNRLRLSSLSAKKRDSVTDNNSSLPPGYFYLTSFHKYWPRIKMIKHSANEDQETFFTFEETAFIAVTHYQNEEVNILKKINNPHAKGFKGSFKDQNNPYISEPENSDNVIESEVDDDNEVEIEEISDIGEKNPSYHQTTAGRSNDSIPLEQKVRQWRQNVSIETCSYGLKSKVARGSSNDTNQTNLHQNIGGFSTKVVKNAHYSLQKHLASHEHPEVNCSSISISRDFSNSRYNSYNNNSGANPSINYKLPDEIDYTAPERPKLDQSISFPKVQQNKHISEQQLQQTNTQQSIWNNCSVPTTPLSPGNIFFSTILNNNESSNPGSSTSYVRLEQAKNENKRLREFIRERYGAEAVKEADAVIALGRKEM
ncbi:hypothetical protein RclHR1_00410013 [Rhizophagus clarus]|uniref:T-box-containing protein TBXT-like n=1 Tax=Rhizophagus clarus TaxID=94130 RepID=A0A2Z6REW9_9GLOM|nr:hypothetical protein RclHR1_00410013 [Rhizophagus clarus]GES78925.1 T-box-containing protein TBXT-like [Rhizophagus clarus]